MLKPMWKRLAWRNPLVSRRYHSPSATDGPNRPKLKMSELPWGVRPPPPPPTSARNTAALIAISARVAGALDASDASPTPRTTFVRCFEHSGQRMPTGLGVMQSGQIGRPQLEQE